MSNEKIPYLCGGVLISLLKQTVQSSKSSKDHLNGTSDSHADSKVMEDFIAALRANDAIEGESPNKTELTKKVVSKYINCKENVTRSLPFTRESFVSTYDDMVKTQYAKAMAKMKVFILLHVDPNYYEWLVKRILYIIDKDSDMVDSDRFFIADDGMPKTKEEVKVMNDFCLPAVLVGIMHYILLYRGENNTEGMATLDKWGPQESHCQRKFNRDAILGVDRDIHVTLECPQPVPRVVVHESRKVEEIPENINCPSKLDVQLYECFKVESEDFLGYIIEHDPAGEPIDRLLPYNIKELIKTWKKRAPKIEGREMQETILLTLDLLNQYAYFISDEFLQVCEDQNYLIFRNQSAAERAKLKEILRPKTSELRYALLRQYRKLYNMPEGAQDFFYIFVEEEEEPPRSVFQDPPLLEEEEGKIIESDF